MSDLVQFCEIKPLAWFRACGEVGLKIDWLYYAKRRNSTELILCIATQAMSVTPLPDCDSFDWHLPRDPTAMELAKKFRRDLQGMGYLTSANRVLEIITAMEREAARISEAKQ